MKFYTFTISLILMLCLSIDSMAQFDLEKKLKKKGNKELNKAADDAIDKSFDAIKNAGKDDNSKSDETSTQNKKANEIEAENNSSVTIRAEEKENLKVWSKYDFVSGDKIIFEDNLTGEENGEFPSRWDLVKGSAEIAKLGEESVIYFSNNKTVILPLMDKMNFLPDVFTIEFDVYFDDLATRRSNYYFVRFYEGSAGNANIDGKRRYPIQISWNEVRMDKLGSKTSNFNEEKKDWNGKWKHVAISFNQRSLKVYLDEERLMNVPNLGYKPEMFSIGSDYDARYIKTSSIKNIRVNEGGKKLYDRIMAEGKFVTRGILFDVNKSTIKGESMGTINEIVKLMKDHSDLKFRIEGHTDSDGDESYNQKLSEERAAAVKNMLVQSGINASRLDSKGYGEGKPINENSTTEGKANNRRVEFVKL
jgi:OOP family OmpA-OmpF porin